MLDTFGQTLRDLRRSKGLSQRVLAEKAGVDFSYISKLENGRLPPPAADTIIKICEVLNVSPDELLAETGKMPTSVREMVTKPSAVEFMREAQAMGLTNEEWQKLTKHLKRLRSN